MKAKNKKKNKYNETNKKNQQDYMTPSPKYKREETEKDTGLAVIQEPQLLISREMMAVYQKKNAVCMCVLYPSI